MKNPAVIIPDATMAIQALTAATERAALALAEALPRLSDRAAPVPGEIWAKAARDYDERGLAALILMIVTTSAYSRRNAATWQVAGARG